MTQQTERMKQIETLLADDPKDEFLRYGLAMEYLAQKEDDTALKLLQELVKDSAYPPAYLQAGQIATRTGQIDLARLLFQQGVAIAQTQGNHHAADEMTRFLEALE